MDEILEEFLIEAHENLETLDRDLVDLEQRPDDKDLLDRIFRSIHTIKGSSGFLGLTELEKVTHAGENLLDLLRDDELEYTAEMGDALLAMADTAREILDRMEEHEELEEGDHSELIEWLETLQQSDTDGSTEDSSKPEPSSEDVGKTEEISQPNTEATEKSSTGTTSGDEAEDESSLQSDSKSSKSSSGTSISESTIRVDVELLDELMNQVGELVLSRNQILQKVDDEVENLGLEKSCQRLDLITTELQENIMKTRMQPIGKIWNKFPRLVRDLTRDTDTNVNLEMEGKETELDKTLIESITAPLTHLVRNAVDHGVEPVSERKQKGKSPGGLLQLKAYHEGGQVNIEISDDGGGMDAEKLKQKGIEKGLISEQQASEMTEKQAYNLVFMPGFSTAQKVTNVSGRGVGMDVVKKNIQDIGGTIDIESEIDEGTTFKINIPLTLAIMPALIVESCSQRFAIPQVNLVELFKADRGDAEKKIEDIHGTPVYRFRGQLLPIVHLNDVLGLGCKTRMTDDDIDEDEVFRIVVLKANERQFGLVVDDIQDTQEIVVKGLSPQINNLDIYAGATILGDGRVVLILDIPGLAEEGEIVSEDEKEKLLDTEDAERQIEQTETQQALLCRSRDDGRMAIPLEHVERLEEVDQENRETAGGENLLQYRDSLMPLVEVDDILPERRSEPRNPEKYKQALRKDTLPVIVYYREESDQRFGLVVTEIMDIVELDDENRRPASRAGVAYTSVVRDRITEVLDIEGIVDQVDLEVISKTQ